MDFKIPVEIQGFWEVCLFLVTFSEGKCRSTTCMTLALKESKDASTWRSFNLSISFQSKPLKSRTNFSSLNFDQFRKVLDIWTNQHHFWIVYLTEKIRIGVNGLKLDVINCQKHSYSQSW